MQYRSRFSKRFTENKIIKEHIVRIYPESKCSFGSPKNREQMKTKPLLLEIPSNKRFKRSMKQFGLFPVTVKRFKPRKFQFNTEDLPNLLNHDIMLQSLMKSGLQKTLLSILLRLGDII